MATNNINNNSEVSKLSFLAKGDLLIGTGNGTYVRLPVGVDGQYIVSDSTQTCGFRTSYPLLSPRIYLSGNGTSSVYGRDIHKRMSDNAEILLTARLSSTTILGAGGCVSQSVYFTGNTRINKLTNDTTCALISASYSANRYYAGSVSYSNAVYIAGGYTTTTSYYNSIYKLTNDTTCALVSATLTSSRSYCHGGVISNSAYFMGGYQYPGAVYINNINKLVSDSSCISIGATLSVSKGRSGVSNISTSLYSVGGYNGSTVITSIDKLTNDTTCATVSATLSSTNYGSNFTAATLNNSCYVFDRSRGFVIKLTNDITCNTVTGIYSLKGPTQAVTVILT